MLLSRVIFAMFRVLHFIWLHQIWIYPVAKSGYPISMNECDDSMRRATTFQDAQVMFDRFTKRYTGKLAFVGEYPSGITSCRMDPLPPISNSLGWIPVAVGPRDYVHSLMCGSCLKISPRKLKKRSINRKRNANFQFNPTSNYFATVVDECVHCKAGDIQMYREGAGTHDIIYEAIDCPEFLGQEGYLRVKMHQCKDKRMKLQVKNTKLPTISLELFQANKWNCMPKTSDNFFLLSLPEEGETYSLPLKARATAITGQTLGFTVDNMENKKEIIIPAQFSPFDTASSGKAPRLKCFAKSDTPSRTGIEADEYDLKKRNMTIEDLHKLPNNAHLLTPDGHLLSQPVNISDTTNHHIAKNLSSNMYTDASNPAYKTNRTSLLSHPNPPLLFSNTTLNQGVQALKLFKKIKLTPPSTCKYDGRYSVTDNCASFYLCEKGKKTLKRCPRGLLFNSVESVCDWPNHVTCARYLGSTLSRGPVADDDDVYTKKFT